MTQPSLGWGLGPDGLSSSFYGPEEALAALEEDIRNQDINNATR